MRAGEIEGVAVEPARERRFGIGDLMSALGVSATSDDPFHRQFREFVKDVHGVDLANDQPPDVHLISDARF